MIICIGSSLRPLTPQGPTRWTLCDENVLTLVQ